MLLIHRRIYNFTGSAVAVSVLRRASRSVKAHTALGAVLAEGVGRAELVAVLAAVAGGADAAAVDGRTLGVVLALAVALAILAISVDRTRARASLAGPAGLAGTLSAPWMAQLGVHALALAYLIDHIVTRVMIYDYLG